MSDDSRLGRCRQGYQAVQGRISCVCAVPWTSPRQASSLGTCDRQEVIGYSLLQRQGRSSWPTASSCNHATLLMRTTNLVMLRTTFLNYRPIIPWRYRGLHHKLRDIPGPRLYHLSQSTDRTIPDDRKGHLNPTKDIVDA